MTNYKGFVIDLSQTDNWSAKITNTRTGKTWCRGPQASLDEGTGPCIQKAKNLIDSYLALRGEGG